MTTKSLSPLHVDTLCRLAHHYSSGQILKSGTGINARTLRVLGADLVRTSVVEGPKGGRHVVLELTNAARTIVRQAENRCEDLSYLPTVIVGDVTYTWEG